MTMAATDTGWRIGPLLALAIFAALFIAIMAFVGPALRAWLTPQLDLRNLHDKAAFRAVLACFFLWLEFGLVVLLLRARGQRLADIGWGRWGTIWGWLAALGYAGFLGWSSVFGTIHFIDSGPWLSDWSPYRVSMMLGLSLTAGICEETIFRGFLMSQTRDARWPVIVQILFSGVAFGLAHAGWGGLGSHFEWQAALGAMAGTTVFGTVFAVIYVISRRALLPAIAGHVLFDMIVEPWMLMMGIAGTLHIGG